MKNLIKFMLTIFLLISSLFIISCSEQKQELPSGTMLHYEIENPENTNWKTYIIEEEQIDLFEKWQTEQKNTLAQKDWEAYIENGN